MPELAFKEKFIAFVDVLGFTSMVEASEKGTGRSLSEVREVLADLGQNKSLRFCPQSRYIEENLDFQITQVSDCLIASAEVSPSGIINLVCHCWGVAISLLAKGVMVRGYITRGNIYHVGNEFMGTGYQEAQNREKTVSAFKREADERGTPFVEVDQSVCEYVQSQTDTCVQSQFNNSVKRAGSVTALFPFRALAHGFIIAGQGIPDFDPEKEKRNNDEMRQLLRDLKRRVIEYVDESNRDAVRKASHYIAALDAQIAQCDKTDRHIDALCSPFPGGSFNPK